MHPQLIPHSNGCACPSGSTRLLLALVLALTALVAPIRATAPVPVRAAGPVCTTSGPESGAYTATVCLSTAGSSTLSGDVSVTSTVTAEIGALPAISKVEVKIAKGTTTTTFGSVLSDYAAPYSFTLPTARWTDGIYRLRTHVTFADGFLPTMPVLEVTFANGVTTAPVSTGSWTPRSAGGSSVVLAAIGDGAGGLTGATDVGSLVAGWNPGMLLYLGDVYNAGTYTEFYNYYAPTLGGLKSITNPVAGNHEGGNQYKGYFDYWNSNTNYYSTSAGGWHLIGLDSNISAQPGSAQYTWLEQDLAAHAGQCTLVFYHHPRFGLDSTGGSAAMDAVWQLMAQHGVDVVLNGHEHNYSRWQPMDATGAVSSTGITQLIAGTGGHTLLGFAKADARVAKRISNVYGALKLTLSPSGAGFQFISTGGTTLDSGTAACNDGPANPTPTPTSTVAGTDVTFSPVADSRVDEAQPTTNFGNTTTLMTDFGAGTRLESYLKFDVSGLTGSVVNARLRLFVSSGSADGFTVHSVSDSSWTETGITWNTRPSRSDVIIDDTGAVATGTWVELNVTGLITGNGTYSVALATTATDGSTISSRQATTNKPELILTVNGSGSPPPTSTPTNTAVATETPTITPTPSPTAGTALLTTLADADARVEELNASNNYGTSTLIRTDAGTGVNVESYLKFTVSGLTGNVVSAMLRVYASTGSVDGPAVYQVTDTTWTEAGITWSNRPERSTTALSDIAAVTGSTWIELDVSSVVGGDGTYSFALATGSTDGTDMRSRETASKPELVILVDNAGPPPSSTVVPTSTPTDIPAPTDTAVPPTDTPVPTDTSVPTLTPVPTETPVPTNTAIPTDTPVPTDTPLPTNTPLPTDTPVPPTNTPVPLTFSVTRTDGGGSTVPEGYTATFDVCVSVPPAVDTTVFLRVNNPARAVSAPDSLTFTPGGPTCQVATLADRSGSGSKSGKARLEVYAGKSGNTYSNLLVFSEQITFP